MKKILLSALLVVLVAFVQTATLQAQCGDRYMLPIFSNVNVVSNVQYGSNVTVDGTTKILQFDFYEPQGDVLEARPLIILAHGGTFVAGDENSADIVYLCQEFAKRGYTCASINYRLLPYATAIASLFDGQIQSVFFDEVAKAVTDMRAAIRYFRQDAATANAYRIDPNQIFIGGASAGAITAVHAAYLTSEDDFAGYTLTGGVTPMGHINNNGGFEGNSGNPGYPSTVSGLINLCGAVGSINFMQAGEAPVVSIHGTADSVVPYGTGSANAFGVPVITVDGSQIIHQRADMLNIPNALLIYPGEDHMAHDSQTNRPESLTFITEFLYDLVECSSVGINQPANTNHQPDITLYPNPTNGNTEATLSFSNFTSPEVTVQLFSLVGQSIVEFTTPSNTFVSLDLSKLSAGMYQLMVSDGKQMAVKKLSVVK